MESFGILEFRAEVLARIAGAKLDPQERNPMAGQIRDKAYMAGDMCDARFKADHLKTLCL